jgi:hypothetical protein
MQQAAEKRLTPFCEILAGRCESSGGYSEPTGFAA